MQIQKLLVTALFTSALSFSALANFTKLPQFGENPGDLNASYFSAQTKAASVVVLLHGCAQEGEALARQSGFLGLAKKHSFALLIPQQSLKNNIKRCFNWYSSDDFSKNKGETLSIKNMISTLQKQLSAEHIYIVGLSAGGAMASSMLVNYPQLFKAGAVVAGIPFPCADGLITGISCMKNGPSQSIHQLVELTKGLNPTQQSWPKLSVWTGAKDNIVNPLNSTSLAQYWASLFTIESSPRVNKSAAYTKTQWQASNGEVQVELFEVSELGHGIMVNPNIENGGELSDYLLNSEVSTAKSLTDFWQIQG